MRPVSRRVGWAAAGAVGAAGVAGAVTAARALDPARRERLARSARVWRLTARRGLGWAAVRVRGAAADEAARAALEERYAIRSAEDVARELGQMKGAIMKVGQLLSFVLDTLPPEAQAALAQLQADVEPMAPGLAAQVIRDELGAAPDEVFLDWSVEPVAAASIGQVHRAVLRDGRVVAVKVQYPGVDAAIQHDLDNAEALYGMFSAFALQNLDVTALVDELRERMADELDYGHEAACQTEFADRYATHPFIHVPQVVPELSTRRVLTSEWVGGMTWSQFEATAAEPERQRAAEVLFRFAQGSIHRHGVFNGDPHPGNYRFMDDGSMTFLDFGLVKRWTAGEWEGLAPVLDAILTADPVAVSDALVLAGFLPATAAVDPLTVFEYVSAPYRPYMVEEYRFPRDFTTSTLAAVADLNGPHRDVIRSLNMPPSFVILDRVVWGVERAALQARGPQPLARDPRGVPP